MKSLKFILMSILFTVGLANHSYASHVAGGNISYVNTGPDTYVFSLSLYRDCAGINAPTAVSLTLTSDCGHSITLPLVNFLVEEISAVDTANCPGTTRCNGGTIPGMELYEYRNQIPFTLPAACNSWTISYNLPARNGAIVNMNPGIFYVQTTMNTVTNNSNTSPSIQWTATNGFDPIPYGCVNSLKTYALNVVEPDGDSLVFSLVNALNGGAGTPSTYNGGFTGTAPIPGITIDSQTGLLSFIAPIVGSFVIVIQIDEYDALGNLLGTMMHELQFVVENCVNNAPLSPNTIANYTNINTNANFDPVTSTISMCAGDQFCFDLTFTDADGDSLGLYSNVTDILPNATFSYTYPPGNIAGDTVIGTVCWAYQSGYTGTIINVTVNEFICIPGSSTYSINLNIPPALNLSPDDSICGIQTAELFATGQGPLIWSVLSGPPMIVGITPGDNFSCQGCFQPIATPTATTTYLVSDGSSCLLTDTVTVTVADNYGDVFSTVFSADTTVCAWDCVNVNAQVQEQHTGIDKYIWNSSSNLFNNGNIFLPPYNATNLNKNQLFVIAQASQGVMLDTVLPGSICEVCININYNFNADNLDIYLEAPNGTRFLLSAGNGGTSTAGYNSTCFNKTSINDITTGFAPFPGTWAPQGGPLSSALVGAPIQGIWSIFVDNNGGPGEFGQISSWSIEFCSPFDFPIHASFFAWDNPDGMPATAAVSPTICPQIGGQYILTAYNIDYCFETDTININLFPLPDAGNDSLVEICKETGIVDLFNYLGGTPLNTGTWQDSSGNAINPLINSASIMDMAPYLYIAQSSDGCLDSAYLTVNIIEVIIDNIIPVNPLCFGFCDGEITIDSPNATHYSYDGGAIGSVNVFNSLCDDSYDLTAHYQLPDGAYCSTSVLNEILVQPPALDIAAFSVNSILNPTTSTDIILCKEDDVPLAASGTGGNANGSHVFDWYMGGTYIGNGANWVTPYNVDGNGMVILSDGICPTDTLYFNIQHPADITPAIFVNKPEGCEDLTVFLKDVTSAIDNYSVTWNISNGHALKPLFEGATLEYIFTEPGLYDISMTVESEHGCIYTETNIQQIDVWADPRLNFTASPIQMTMLEPTTTMVNLSGSNAVKFDWKFGSLASPQSIDDEDEPTVTYPDAIPGRYPIELTGYTAHGCSKKINGIVEILNDVNIFAPNTFTPDGNNFNDTWRVHISGIDIYEFELTIFNRFGEIIWKSYDAESEWDGTYGKTKKPVLDGTYPWIVTAKDALDDGKYEFRGAINIIR